MMNLKKKLKLSKCWEFKRKVRKKVSQLAIQFRLKENKKFYQEKNHFFS